MRLLDIIQGRLVIPQLRSRTKWEALDELVAGLVEEHEIPLFDRPEILAAVRDREESLSTGLRAHVALPHARTRAVDDLVGILGISPGGIPFDSLDGKPARLILLMIVPDDQYQEHIRTLANASQLLSQPALQGRVLFAAKGGRPKDIIVAIEQVEGPDFLDLTDARVRNTKFVRRLEEH